MKVDRGKSMRQRGEVPSYRESLHIFFRPAAARTSTQNLDDISTRTTAPTSRTARPVLGNGAFDNVPAGGRAASRLLGTPRRQRHTTTATPATRLLPADPPRRAALPPGWLLDCPQR
ncbi:hypothetical protein IMZ48_36815, partial [Candidatus Bathyarchaeota archaeon]|nr:hypothetical protein [Candidatus Bathyarchaeota archaeon]